MKTSRFLDDPRFVRKYDVRIAAELGDRAATFIQQVHYHATWKEENYGTAATEWRASLSEWERAFPFWCLDTIKRVIKICKKAGVLKVRKDTFQGRKAIWYSIDYDVLEKLGEAGEAKVQNQLLTGCKTSFLHGAKPAFNIAEIQPHLVKQKTTTTTGSNTPTEAVPAVLPRMKGISAERLQELKDSNRAKVLAQVSKSGSPQSIARLWEMLVVDKYTRAGYIPMGTVDRKLVKEQLLGWCKDGGVDLVEFLSWCVSDWEALRDHHVKWAKIPQYPTFKQIYRLKDDLLGIYKSGRSTGEVRKTTVYTSVDQIPKDHPRYKELKQVVERIGRVELI